MERSGKRIKKNGVEEVKFVEAVHSIEDWFLIDGDGVLNFLSLPKQKNKINLSCFGLKELERLFKQAGRVYAKGKKCEGLIENLNMKKILSSISQEVMAIYEELTV